MTIPPYAIAAVLTVGTAVLSERTQKRAVFIMASSSVSIIGYVILLASTSAGLSYFGTILAAAGIYPGMYRTYFLNISILPPSHPPADEAYSNSIGSFLAGK